MIKTESCWLGKECREEPQEKHPKVRALDALPRKKSTGSYHSRVRKSLWVSLTLILRNIRVHRTKPIWCLLLTQRSPG